jgi:hypothetical protein
VEAALDRSDASALADLQMHWDEAYDIGLDGDIWSARFRGSTDELRAHTSHELRDLIRTDYTYRHNVSRVRGANGSTDADSSAAPPAGPRSREHDDDDLYRAQYDDGTQDVDDTPAVRKRTNFTDIRGERMST